MMIIWTTNFNLKTITKRTKYARVMDHGHMPQQSKGKHTIRLGSQESDSTLDHKPLRYTNRHFKHHRTESQRSVPSLVPWLLMLNPNHTNEETCNQSTKETPEERTNKERTGSLGSSPLPQRKAAGGLFHASSQAYQHSPLRAPGPKTTSKEDKERRASQPAPRSGSGSDAWQQQRTCSTISLSWVTRHGSW
jgi:hypothetical protein